jgi:hypothetical protein
MLHRIMNNKSHPKLSVYVKTGQGTRLGACQPAVNLPTCQPAQCSMPTCSMQCHVQHVPAQCLTLKTCSRNTEGSMLNAPSTRITCCSQGSGVVQLYVVCCERKGDKGVSRGWVHHLLVIICIAIVIVIILQLGGRTALPW